MSQLKTQTKALFSLSIKPQNPNKSTDADCLPTKQSTY
jgi:hypothetical protein